MVDMLMSLALAVSVVVVPRVQRMFGTVIVMAMSPEQEFFEHEEQRDAGDERDAHLVHILHARSFNRVRDQGEECRA